MQRDNRAELRLGVARKERFERSLAPVARTLPGNFFYLRDELRIQRRAAFCQLDGGDHPGIFRRGGNDSRAGPGSFLARLLPVEDGNVQALARQLQRDRAANRSAAGDGYVDWFDCFGVRVW